MPKHIKPVGRPKKESLFTAPKPIRFEKSDWDWLSEYRWQVRTTPSDIVRKALKQYRTAQERRTPTVSA